MAYHRKSKRRKIHRKHQSRLKRTIILTGKVILALVIVYGLYVICISAYNTYKEGKRVPITTTSIEIPALEPTPENWLKVVNEERAKVGAKPLELHPGLNKSAQLKAEEMKAENYFDHYNRKGVQQGLRWAQRELPRCRYVSENLAQTAVVESALSSFMASSAHREAILDPKYEYLGIGIVEGYTVQHFADCV